MKKFLSMMLCAATAASLLGGCGEAPASETATTDAPTEEVEFEEKDGGKKVGITLQSLSNVYWPGVMNKLEEILDENGYEYTIVDCEDNSGTQVGQIENFITSGCDLILVHASDPEAVEGVCGEALDQGIKVMCWDDPMENSTANWVLDNTELGKEIGKEGAEWINAHYTADNKAKVTVIGKASTKVLFDRANGIKLGLEEFADPDKYEIIAEVDGLEAPEAQSNIETVMSAHPDANVFLGVGAGAMVGCNEALLAEFGKGNIPEDYAVITTDVTTQQLESLKAGDEGVRAIIGFEGSNYDTAKACYDMFDRILSGEDFSKDKNVYRGIAPITDANIDEILAGM